MVIRAPFVPADVQTAGGVAENVTGFPDPPPVAHTVNGPAPYVLLLKAPKLIVWDAGEIVKVPAFDVPPPGVGETTVTDTAWAASRLVAGMVTVSVVLLTKVVVRAVPPNCATEELTNPVPEMVSGTEPPPTVVPVGLIPVIAGVGLVASNCAVAIWFAMSTTETVPLFAV
jgi:hypothetical protein